jgi:hypothetical protein
MSNTIEEKDSRIPYEEEYQADYILELRPIIQQDKHTITLDINKQHSNVPKMLHNLNHRSINNQRKELIEVE